MDTLQEITRMNRLLEVEESAFQHQLEDAVSFCSYITNSAI